VLFDIADAMSLVAHAAAPVEFCSVANREGSSPAHTDEALCDSPDLYLRQPLFASIIQDKQDSLLIRQDNDFVYNRFYSAYCDDLCNAAGCVVSNNNALAKPVLASERAGTCRSRNSVVSGTSITARKSPILESITQGCKRMKEFGSKAVNSVGSVVTASPIKMNQSTKEGRKEQSPAPTSTDAGHNQEFLTRTMPCNGLIAAENTRTKGRLEYAEGVISDSNFSSGRAPMRPAPLKTSSRPATNHMQLQDEPTAAGIDVEELQHELQQRRRDVQHFNDGDEGRLFDVQQRQRYTAMEDATTTYRVGCRSTAAQQHLGNTVTLCAESFCAG